MKQKNKRKEISKSAPRCPYCGSSTILRSADGIYKNNSRSTMLYVCKNYPKCDSYVRVHDGTTIPMGTVANRELRALRREAHKHFDKLYEEGYMTKDDAYQWLASLIGIPLSEAHIGYFGDYYCKKVIEASKKELALCRRRAAAHQAKFQKGGAKAS